EFRLALYDGYHLEGRLLLGATIDPLVINGDLIEDRDVELNEIRACGKTEVLRHFIVDTFGPPRPVTLRRGYWYGSNMDFFLWDERESGIGPDCFEARLVVFARGRRTAATLPIRVERTDKPSVLPDGGIE